MPDAFSPINIDGALVFPDVSLCFTEVSTTLIAETPFILQ